MEDKLLEGYEFFKSIQGKKYDKNDLVTKSKLQEFRKVLGNFTDNLFHSHSFSDISNGKGQWQNSGNYSKYMWNRYKLPGDDSYLVIYFNASAINDEGLFISIGLIDDKIIDDEKSKQRDIYNFLEKACENISCNGFANNKTSWSTGDRVFKIKDLRNYQNVDYDCLLNQLKEVYQKTIDTFYKKNIKKDGTISQEDNLSLQKKKDTFNKILYGPPGTGKTYNTIDQALQIIDGTVPDNREEAKERFEVLKEAGQIEFVSFHQSYGYEEFVEGIKADVDSDDIRYSIEDGIFKRLSRVAEKNYRKSKIETYVKKDFEEVFKDKILDKLNEDKLKIDTPQKYFYITDVNDKTIFFEKASGNTGHTLSIRSLKKMYEIGKNDFLMGGLAVYYQPILELLLEDAEITSEPEELKSYILIIDEINRGNISKIFGELITLIEYSKRIGEDEAIEITLPYSGENFGVPNNLYILGTMNTADRSIALMDTALRRRFEFEEMMPKPELLSNNVEGIDLQKLLSKINQRIEYLYDRDHTIGHAYFIDVKDKKDLDSAMRNKVIPLLQEYFYDDWEKIRLVLNDGFISKTEQKPNDIFDTIDDELVDEEKYSYDIVDSFSEEAYRKIYE